MDRPPPSAELPHSHDGAVERDVQRAYDPMGDLEPLDPEAPQLFENREGHNLQRELDLAEDLGIRPIAPEGPDFDRMVNADTIKWAVLADESLLVEPAYVDQEEISHAVLSGGEPVLAAGTADISGNAEHGYWGARIDNHSGHFLPSAESLQRGVDAFAAYGITFPPDSQQIR